MRVSHAGRLLTCALQNLARIKAYQPKAGTANAPSAHTLASCVVLLERLVVVVFPDFGYVAHFLEHCKPAIERLHCGQPLLPPSAEAPGDTLGTLHSQVKTVDCLMMHVRRLEPECRTQVVRLGEVQADDWARDRSFYYACVHDREALCPAVVAGTSASSSVRLRARRVAHLICCTLPPALCARMISFLESPTPLRWSCKRRVYDHSYTLTCPVRLHCTVE